jgi:anthranilate phosphoribosyltransferase
MFVAAAAGARVAKHGGRSVSSKSGSADVLEALGASIDLTPAQVAVCMAETGIGFMFAPNHHPAMKVVAPVRKEMGVRTLFNILGPLTNPAGAPNILMGVFHPDLVGIQVRVLQQLGAKHALVVWGRDGMDEISLGAAPWSASCAMAWCASTRWSRRISAWPWPPAATCAWTTPTESKAMLLDALPGRRGVPHDIVCLNAGAALYAADVVDSIDTASRLRANDCQRRGACENAGLRGGYPSGLPARCERMCAIQMVDDTTSPSRHRIAHAPSSEMP